jgi:hypothetical protein
MDPLRVDVEADDGVVDDEPDDGSCDCAPDDVPGRRSRCELRDLDLGRS